jgi:hypothetical protein
VTYYPLGRGEDMSEGEYQYQMALCDAAGNEDAIYESSSLHPLEEPLSPVPEGFWRVRGGALLEIAKMSTEHLKNAINYFERNDGGRHSKIEELRAELERRT